MSERQPGVAVAVAVIVAARASVAVVQVQGEAMGGGSEILADRGGTSVEDVVAVAVHVLVRAVRADPGVGAVRMSGIGRNDRLRVNRDIDVADRVEDLVAHRPPRTLLLGLLRARRDPRNAMDGTRRRDEVARRLDRLTSVEKRKRQATEPKQMMNENHVPQKRSLGALSVRKP